MGKNSLKLTDIISCILIFIILYGSYKSATQGEGFAIYLTQEDVPPANMDAFSYVQLSDQPIISVEDIISYNAQTHEIKLKSNAFERICKMDVPVTGKSFIVCVNEEPIYWGAFWISISSISFDGVTILQPYNNQELKIITLDLGYPSSFFFSGEDPRSKVKVLESLLKADKLIIKMSLPLVEKLPHSMKGYELYSWEENGLWYYTLITGTNRVKTMAEIITDEDFISEIGWVNIHVQGDDAIKNVLSKLPNGESVFWCDELHIGVITGSIDLQLPPKQTVDSISEFAEQLGLDFGLIMR